MIIQALNEHYERLKDNPQEDIPLLGFSRRGVSFVLIITRDGILVDINDIRDERSKSKQMIMPAAVIRTRNANQKPNFLCDSAKFVLGYDIDNPGSGSEAHDSFCKLHKEIGDGLEDEGMQAVLQFLKKWEPKQFESSLCHKYKEDIVAGNIVFNLESQPREYIHDRPVVKNAWLKRYFNSPEEYVAMCLVTGRKEQIAKLHDGIKGVANPTHPVGAIVSFNQNSFCSYGKEQSLNAPISKEVMFNYTTVLNHMLRKESRQKIQIGDATTVFWAEGETPVVEFLKDIFDPRDTAVDISGLRLFLEAARDGKKPELSGTEGLKFYILGLAPNAKRLSVRFWYVSTVGEISKKIGQHFSDLRIQREFEDKQPEYPGIWQLLHVTAVRGKTDNISPILAGAVARSILTGVEYPRALLTATLERVRTEQNVGYYRAALIKAYLVRHNRIQQKKIKEVGMALDKEQRNIGYLLGRLFAVLEKAQKDAIPGANTTIKDRFYGSASATPSVVFPQLMRLAQHHIQKSGYGGLIEKAIEGIMADVKVFPAHLSLEEQGMFALGYYHQKPEMYKKTEKKEEE